MKTLKLLHDQPRERLREGDEHRPHVRRKVINYVLMSDRSMNLEVIHFDCSHGRTKTVTDECNRLRTQMEGIDARYVEALKAGWSHITAETNIRQNTLVTRIGQVEGHLNTLARDQSNAVESSQATWRSIQELKTRASELNVKIQDVGASMEQKLIEVQGLPLPDLHNEFKKEVYETLAEFKSNLVKSEAISDQIKRAVGGCQ